MGSQTPVLGMPYPEGTDRVMDGDDAIQALAERIESQLKIKAGKATVTTDSLGNYVFPHGLGVVPRCVVATPQIQAGALIVNTYGPGMTATNVHIVIKSHDGTNIANTSVIVNWIAIG
jgi:hypothetical protein